MSFKKMVYSVDTHSGEPMRVITGGLPNIPGDTVYDQMVNLRENDQELIHLMLKEPRGYPPLCCNLIVPPKHPNADMGYIVMEQIECPVVSGGNTIAVVTVLLETGMLPMIEPFTELTLEAPAGLIHVRAECSYGKVQNVTFKNVPAFAPYVDQEIDVPRLGRVKVDIGWGGMFYAITDVRQFEGLELIPEHGREIARISSMVRKAAEEQLPVAHPHYPNVGISISQLSGPANNSEADRKNVVTVASGTFDWNNPSTWTGALDRCPCGTGTSAKMATLYAKGELGLNEDFRHEGILNTIYTGRLVEEVYIGEHKAVVPTISGQAWITAYNTYVLDHSDPFPKGFTVGDIWA